MGFTERYIKITRENEMEVLKVLEELGCKWGSGNEEPTKWIPSEHHWFEDYDEEIIKIEYDEVTDNNILKGHYTNFVKGYKETSLDELKSYLPKDKTIVRSLNDLDGLDNGIGLHISLVHGKSWLKVSTKNKMVVRLRIVDDEEIAEANIILKAIGFKFEYKPLRTIDEIESEIKSLKSEMFFPNSENYFVTFNITKNRYMISLQYVGKSLSEVYMSKEKAQKYVDELNEVLKYNISNQ